MHRPALRFRTLHIPLLSPPPPFIFHLLFTIMNVPQFYAIAAGGVFVLLLIMKSVSAIQQFLRALAILVAKHLTYPFLVRRRRLLGPWSRADVLLQVTYLTINIFCLTFRVSSVKEVGARAGTLALINMAPLFFGFHLSFLADILGISLSNIRRMHRMMGGCPSCSVSSTHSWWSMVIHHFCATCRRISTLS